MINALLLGLLASLFFSITFILNHAMQATGGHWIWTASLRFAFMLPMLFALLLKNGRYRPVLKSIRENPLAWLLWSTVGFGFFYLPLCVAAAFGPSWMIASTWQITIVAGILLTPLFKRLENGRSVRNRIPLRQLAISGFIIIGVFLVQYTGASVDESQKALLAITLMLIAAFSYPLGNRKLLAMVPEGIGTLERVFGMTLCSMPFWAVAMIAGVAMDVYPTASQVNQTLLVALSSGVIATWLFFKATKKAKNDVKWLAVIESTQAGEVVFTLILGMAFFGDKAPSPKETIGLIIIIVGIVLNGLSGKAAK